MNKKKITNIVLGVLFVAGLSLLLYPTVAGWWNSTHASRAVAKYNELLQNISDNDYSEMLEEARTYNENLIHNKNRFFPTEEDTQEYNNLLSIDGSTVMGSVQIPAVKINLPIYHGTSEEVLRAGVGHLEGSSLPIGGIGTHAVLSGHRGLTSAKLFDDVVNLVEGDIFIVTVLNETLTYEVDKIRTVLPDDVSNINISPNEDLCTLVTCTPYGINTHRILITGHRIENLSEWEAVSDAGQIDTKMVALWIAIPILVGLFIWLMIYYRKPRGDSDEEDKNNSNQ